MTLQENILDPQRWNRYTYARNNPLRYVDPDGRAIDILVDAAGIAYGASDIAATYLSGNSPTSTQWLALGGDVVGAAIPFVTGVGAAIRAAAKNVDEVAPTIGQLRKAGQADAHHIIQDAAVRDLPGYNTNAAPGLRLKGPSRAAGTPHSAATQVQRETGGGSYGAERRIGYKALRRAGQPKEEARAGIERADKYFEGLGVTRDTPTRIPGNRRKPE